MKEFGECCKVSLIFYYFFNDLVGEINMGQEKTTIEMNWRNVKGLILYYG